MLTGEISLAHILFLFFFGMVLESFNRKRGENRGFFYINIQLYVKSKIP